MVLLPRVLIRVSTMYMGFLFHFLCGHIQYNRYCRFRNIATSLKKQEANPLELSPNDNMPVILNMST